MSQDFQSAWPLPPSHYKKFSVEEIQQLEPPPIPDEKNLQVFGLPIFEVLCRHKSNYLNLKLTKKQIIFK